MYILNRKEGERIVITMGEECVELVVLSNRRVKLGIVASPNIKIERLGAVSGVIPYQPNDSAASEQPSPAA